MLESHSRKYKSIFEGMGESTPEDINGKLLAIFKDKMKIDNLEDIKIVRAHCLGQKRTPNAGQ